MICPVCGQLNLPGTEQCSNCLFDLMAIDRPLPADRVEGSLLVDRVSVLKPKPPVTVDLDATLGEAISKMISQSVGALLVLGADGELVGILTERDFLTKVAGSPDFAGQLVRDFMTANPETTALTDPLASALAKMDGGGYRHLPIITAGKPAGVISVRDMLRHLVHLCG